MINLLIPLTTLSVPPSLHASNINPSNIIFTNNHDDNSIKLVDFGCALEAKGRCIDEYVGVHHYLAPEIVEGRPYGA
jgi:serine/threonine protein kinase